MSTTRLYCQLVMTVPCVHLTAGHRVVIQFRYFHLLKPYMDSSIIVVDFFSQVPYTWLCRESYLLLQTIDTFQDSVMSIAVTSTEIIAGSVDGTVRTFDIRMGRYVHSLFCPQVSTKLMCIILFPR
jgi:hypothetical protein